MIIVFDFAFIEGLPFLGEACWHRIPTVVLYYRNQSKMVTSITHLVSLGSLGLEETCLLTLT